MRGDDLQQQTMFSYISLEARVPKDHPLRPIRIMVDNALIEMAPLFDRMYSHTGRPSIPPEHLLRALLLQILYSVRSERMLIEQLDYNLLSSDHFTVDGTLIEAWASIKSFRPKDDQEPPTGNGRNPEVDFKGQKRKNDTHQSTTDPDARLYKKAKGKEAKLCFMGHALMENRSGLVVDSRLTQATGTAEREAALEMVENIPGVGRITLGADKGYDTSSFVRELRRLKATPHVAQKSRGTAIDKRTTRHAGYQVSLKIRKRVEEIFGWMKETGPIRKTSFQGLERVECEFTLAAAAYNLVRLRTLIWAP